MITTADYHTAGKPFRIVTGGVQPLRGETILAKRRDALERLDGVRRLLVYEPRGHADMYGCHVVVPNDEGADLGVVFFHNAGYSTACGHGTIASSRGRSTRAWSPSPRASSASWWTCRQAGSRLGHAWRTAGEIRPLPQRAVVRLGGRPARGRRHGRRLRRRRVLRIMPGAGRGTRVAAPDRVRPRDQERPRVDVRDRPSARA
jgi:proline racemase